MLEKYSSLSTRNFRLQSHELNLQQQKYENLGYQKAVRNNRLFFTIILSTWKKFHAKMNLLEALEFQGDFQTNVEISKTSIK